MRHNLRMSNNVFVWIMYLILFPISVHEEIALRKNLSHNKKLLSETVFLADLFLVTNILRKQLPPRYQIIPGKNLFFIHKP